MLATMKAAHEEFTVQGYKIDDCLGRLRYALADEMDNEAMSLDIIGMTTETFARYAAALGYSITFTEA